MISPYTQRPFVPSPPHHEPDAVSVAVPYEHLTMTRARIVVSNRILFLLSLFLNSEARKS